MQKIAAIQVLANLILIFYYTDNRKTEFWSNDWKLIEALIFTITAGTLILIFKNEELMMFINTVGFYFTHSLYISIFRNEGSTLPHHNDLLKNWRILLFTLAGLVVILVLVMPYLPNVLLVVSFVYSTQMMILCWMAFFRPIPKKIFLQGLLGTALLLFSNLWLPVNLFVYKLPYPFFIHSLLYCTANFFVVKSILEVNSNRYTDFNLPSNNQS